MDTTYKDDFLAILLQQKVLLFGDFLTKSGRRSPYFFNTGKICDGAALSAMAKIYAEATLDFFGHDFDNLFGPAYKGIPLACATAMALSAHHKKPCTYTFNRKEQKTHGEGGALIGAEYSEATRVLIIEDVLTAGTSLRDSIDLLKTFPVQLLGAIVGIDRQEKGTKATSARQELESDYGLSVKSIINLDEIVARLWNKPVLGKVWIDDDLKSRIDDYRSKFAT